MSSKGEIILLHGNSYPLLADSIGKRLGIAASENADVTHTTSKETDVRIKMSVRGRPVFILQTGCRSVNDVIFELLIMLYACKTSSCSKIIAVVPYLPYAKQSKMRKRGSVVASLLATMMEKAGMDHLITIDLNQKEIQGFFTKPVENLRASPYLVQYVKENISEYSAGCVVARNPNCVERAAAYAERLQVTLAVIHRTGAEVRQTESELDRSDGRSSPVPAHIGDYVALANDKHTNGHNADANSESITMMTASMHFVGQLVGDVTNRPTFIVDVIIDEMDEIIACAELLKRNGATSCYVLATHGVFSADAPEKLEAASAIDLVIVTNTVPHEEAKARCSKIQTVDISPMIAEAIRRVHYDESLSFLFRNVLPSGD